MRPDSPRDFGAIQIIYLLTYLLTCSNLNKQHNRWRQDLQVIALRNIKSTSGCLTQHFGFEVSFDGTVLSVEND